MINFAQFSYQQDNLERAEALCDMAMQHSHGFDVDLVYLLKGDVRAAHGDHEGAEQVYRQAFAAGETMAAAKLARLLHSRDRIEEAQEWAERFVVCDSAGNRVKVDLFGAD